MVLNISGNITEEMVATTITDYIIKKGFDTSDEDIYKQPEIIFAERIINLQVAYFIIRRTPVLCGSVCDWYLSEISSEKRNFKFLFGEFQDFNENVDW